MRSVARTSTPTPSRSRRELLSLYLETKRLDSYSRETEELAGLHLSHDQVKDAIQVLSENLTRLIEIKEFRLVAGLLDPFRNLVHESPVLLRFMALSLEGIGREREACTLWIELADLHERDHAPVEMEKVLRRAVALKPKDLLLRQRLIAVLRLGEEERKPDLVAELQELASILEGQKSKDELRDAYEQILSLDPDNADALSGLSKLLIATKEKVRAAELLIRLGDVQKDMAGADAALPSYRRAAELDPASGTARRRLMDAGREAGDMPLFTQEAFALAEILLSIAADEDALCVYTTVLRELPENRECLQRLADLHLRRGEETTAASHLRELYRLDLESGNLSQAFDVLHRIEKLDPENAETQELLGRLYLRIHDRDQAFSYLKSAAEKQAASGNLAVAIAITGDLIALDPHEKALRKLRANLFMHAGDKDSAVVEFLELANIHRLEEDLEAELRALREAVTLRPDNLEYRERLALLLSDMDEPQEAFEQFMRLASERENHGNPDGAIEALRMAVMLVPDSFDVQVRLADLYEGRGDTIHAESALLWLADWHEAQSDSIKACQAIERILKFSRSSALLSRASRLMHQAGRNESAAELYRELLAQAEVDGEGSIAREAAEALLSIRNHDVEVIRRVGRHYMKADEKQRAMDVFFEGFAAIVQDGDIDAAQSLIPDLLAASPGVLEMRERIAGVYATNGIPELAARDLLDIARELDASSSPDEALRAVDVALSHAPNSQQARELRFALLIKTGNANEAYDLGEKLIAFLESRGSGEPMLAIAKQMIALRPQEPAPREAIIRHLRETNQTVPLTDEMRHLAEIYTLRKELDKASSMLQDLLRVLPDDTRARTQYIDTYRQIGPEGDLINDYAKLAEIHTRHGAILEATKIYEKILAIAPQQLDLRDRFIEFLVLHAQTTRAIPESYQLVGLCLENHQPRKALRVLDRVARHVTDDPDYHHLLGRVHRELNSRGMAAKCFERAADIYRTAGNTVRQIEVLRELLKIDSLNLEVRQRMIEALVGSEQKSEAVSAMEELGRTYMERGLPDLAQAEYRRIIAIDPTRQSAWESLFSATERFGKAEDLAPDYIAFAEQMADLGNPAKAIEYLKKIVTMEIPDVQLRKKYIDLYLRAGKPKEIVEDIIALAQTLVESGNVDEAIQYFERAMSIDPGNTKARDLLTATHVAPSSDGSPSGKADSSSAADDPRRKALRRIDSSLDLAEASSQMGAPGSVTASDYLLGTISQLERQESEEALAQIVNNYLDILSVNAQNAAVRVKLADVLEQMGRIPQMLQQLAIASETYFNKNELSQCATVCERYLHVNPGDQRIRKRLNEAILKRDAYKAIESAILYTDKPSTGSPDSRTTG
jgi:tetratricopeptide (TPR) repeat protein